MIVMIIAVMQVLALAFAIALFAFA